MSEGKEEPAGLRPIDVLGQDAAVLSAVEVGLGSVLHSFRIPFSGNFLSLNQAFMLTRTTRKLRGLPEARTAPLVVSGIAALLKSLSPAGKKLTPMLAISAQGLMYSLGTLVLGPGPAGMLLGSVLLSVWSFAQPALIYLILFGKPLVEAGAYFLRKAAGDLALDPERLLQGALAVVAIKALLACVACLLALRLPEGRFRRYQARLLEAGRARRERAASAALGAQARAGGRGAMATHARGAAGDLLNPLFGASLAMTAFFFVCVEASFATLAWGLLRPVAAGFLLFFLVRAIPLERLLAAFELLGLRSFGEAFRRAAHALRRI